MIFIIKNSIDSLIKALDGLLSMSNELDDVIELFIEFKSAKRLLITTQLVPVLFTHNTETLFKLDGIT